MPKIRAGRRHHLYKSKNSERKRQTLQTITNTIDNQDAIDLFEGLKQELSSSLLSGWHVFANSDTIQMSLVSNSPPEPSVVRIILTVHKHFKWAVHVYGKVVPSNSGFVRKFPTCLKTKEEVHHICTSLQGAALCEGNNDDRFIELVVKRGGVFKNRAATTVTAFLDEKNHTVRHQNCEIILAEKGQCSTCHNYRPTLRAMCSKKESSQSSKTSSSRLVMLIIGIYNIVSLQTGFQMCNRLGGQQNKL